VESLFRALKTAYNDSYKTLYKKIQSAALRLQYNGFFDIRSFFPTRRSLSVRGKNI